jgi:hypothetical protein
MTGTEHYCAHVGRVNVKHIYMNKNEHRPISCFIHSEIVDVLWEVIWEVLHVEIAINVDV